MPGALRCFAGWVTGASRRLMPGALRYFAGWVMGASRRLMPGALQCFAGWVMGTSGRQGLVTAGKYSGRLINRYLPHIGIGAVRRFVLFNRVLFRRLLVLTSSRAAAGSAVRLPARSRAR